MDEMVLLPTEGIEEEQTAQDTMPWLERRRRGLFRAWWSTTKLALFSPGRLMRATPLESPTEVAWSFGIFNALLCSIALVLPIGGMILIVHLGWKGKFVVDELLGMLLFSLLLLVATLLFMLIWSLSAHGLLRLMGRTAGPWGRTAQAICYSSGANLASAVPCLGYYLGWIWYVVSAIVCLKEAQRVSGLRAAVAVLALPLFILAGLITGYLFLIFGVLGTAFNRTNSVNVVHDETQIVLQALLQHGNPPDGPAIPHVLKLVDDGHLGAIDLVSGETATELSDVPVAAISLEDYESARPFERKAAYESVIASMPPNVAAYRMGDFVFTHGGINPSQANPMLWLVIWSPDPEINAAPSPGDRVAVGLADGTVLSIDYAQFGSALVGQNTLRAAAGLPPIPDPATVRHVRTNPSPK